jgi:hypothetical protein
MAIMRKFYLGLGAAVLSAGLGRADVKMPVIFGDHMVLQQDGKIPVWGTADPGEKVTASTWRRCRLMRQV